MTGTALNLPEEVRGGKQKKALQAVLQRQERMKLAGTEKQ